MESVSSELNKLTKEVQELKTMLNERLRKPCSKCGDYLMPLEVERDDYEFRYLCSVCGHTTDWQCTITEEERQKVIAARNQAYNGQWLSADEAKQLLAPFTKISVDNTIYSFSDTKALKDGIDKCLSDKTKSSNGLLSLFLKLTSLARGYDVLKQDALTIAQIQNIPNVQLLE